MTIWTNKETYFTYIKENGSRTGPSQSELTAYPLTTTALLKNSFLKILSRKVAWKLFLSSSKSFLHYLHTLLNFTHKWIFAREYARASAIGVKAANLHSKTVQRFSPSIHHTCAVRVKEELTCPGLRYTIPKEEFVSSRPIKSKAVPWFRSTVPWDCSELRVWGLLKLFRGEDGEEGPHVCVFLADRPSEGNSGEDTAAVSTSFKTDNFEIYTIMNKERSLYG